MNKMGDSISKKKEDKNTNEESIHLNISLKE